MGVLHDEVAVGTTVAPSVEKRKEGVSSRPYEAGRTYSEGRSLCYALTQRELVKSCGSDHPGQKLPSERRNKNRRAFDMAAKNAIPQEEGKELDAAMNGRKKEVGALKRAANGLQAGTRSGKREGISGGRLKGGS